MSFEKHIEQIGLASRSPQIKFANTVEQVISEQKIGLLQADTGVGKTLGYLIPALLHVARTGERLIIGVGTLNLIQQISNKEIHTALKVVKQETGKTLKVFSYLGRKHYISPERLEQALSDVSPGLKRTYRAEIYAIRHWKKSIVEFVTRYGELPCGLNEDDICKLRTYTSDELKQREKRVAESDVIITTHAMLTMDAFSTGGILQKAVKKHYPDRKSILVVDEADGFHAALAAHVETRLNLHHFSSVLSAFAPQSLIRYSQSLGRKVVKLSEGRSFQSSSEIQGVVRSAIKHYRRALSRSKYSGASEKAWELLSLSGFLSSKSVTIGVGVDSLTKEPALVFINPFATRLCGSYLEQHYQSACFVSATLSTHDDLSKGVRWFIKDLKLPEDRLICDEFSPEHYGDMNVFLQSKSAPKPFSKSEQDGAVINTEFVKACAEAIYHAPGQNKLVLTGSYQESKLLHHQLALLNGATPITVHQKGEKLETVKFRYMEVGGILITPGGHIGLDIRNEEGGQFLDEVVITRIPYRVKDSRVIEDYADHLREVGMGEHSYMYAQNFFMQKTMTEAIRKLKQALGRGIRGENDKVDIYILDPRFPSYLEKGSYFTNQLKSIFPKRFKSSYMKATILGSHVPSAKREKPKTSELIF